MSTFLSWWTSIETDTRKTLLVAAHRDTQRLHALIRMAYDAGTKSRAPAQEPGEQQAQSSAKGGDAVGGMNSSGALAAMCACGCLLMGVVFTVQKQDEIRQENNAFARDCNERGGQVRMEFNMHQCVGARQKGEPNNG